MINRTEKEKMLAGERYNCLDPDLEAERQQAKALMERYNGSTTEEERQALLRQMLGGVGENPLIWPPFYYSYGKHTYFGDYVFLNYMCVILDNNEVRFGNHVMVGPCVQFYTAAHDLIAETRNQGFEVAKPITIEDNVWIGGGAILLPGVRVGRNAVVGAGAVVSKDVPANTIVAGNPARIIRKIEQG
jgi:maltose O-acetyltransferase